MYHHCSMQLNMTMVRTAHSLLVVVFVVFAAGAGIAGTDARPQLVQSVQSAQHAAAADGRSYAAAYGHAAVGGALRPSSSPAAVHVGYVPTAAVYKPDLSAYAAAPFPLVEQLRRFDPVVRPVQTVVPRVTAVEPSVSVYKTYVDVPVPVPVPAAAAYAYEYGPAAVQLQRDPSAYYYRHDYGNQLLADRK